MTKKTVLITGCSSGLGRQTATYFHDQGWNVIATMRSPEKESELSKLDNVLVSALDVTDVNSVRNAINEGVEKFGKIDALVNNAGYAESAVFEQWTEEEMYALFETNVFGMMRVTKEVLPIMRKQRSGAIVNISSLAGLVGSPFSSVYSATKYAVEGFTESLALEYGPFGIKVAVVAPGAYNTNLISSQHKKLLGNGDEEIKAYSAQLAQALDDNIKRMTQQGGQESHPQEVAEVVFKCVTEKTPIHNISGADAEAVVAARKSLSEEDFIDNISSLFTAND